MKTGFVLKLTAAASSSRRDSAPAPRSALLTHREELNPNYEAQRQSSVTPAVPRRQLRKGGTETHLNLIRVRRNS